MPAQSFDASDLVAYSTSTAEKRREWARLSFGTEHPIGLDPNARRVYLSLPNRGRSHHLSVGLFPMALSREHLKLESHGIIHNKIE